MKTNLIYCLPLYLFSGACILTLLYYFFKAVLSVVSFKKVLSITFAGFLTISAVYVVVTSLFI